jgi:hypothetical protein
MTYIKDNYIIYVNFFIIYMLKKVKINKNIFYAIFFLKMKSENLYIKLLHKNHLYFLCIIF